MQKRNIIVTLIIIFITALILSSILVGLYADGLWFSSVGFLSIFTTRLLTQSVLWACGFVVTALVLGINFHLAARMSPLRYIREIPEVSLEISTIRLTQIAKWVAVGLVLMISAIVAKSAADQWFEFQAFFHQVSFGTNDPVFSKDVSFYVFTLPVIVFLHRYVMTLTVLSGLGSAIIYFAKGGMATPDYRISSKAAKHLSVLAAIFFAIVAWGYWIDRFKLLFSPFGITFGAGYADVQARIPAYWIMLVVSLVVAGIILKAGRQRKSRLALAGPVVFVAFQVFMWIAPAIMQTFVVDPNEFTKERPYIENNIQATRQAYGLDRVKVKPYSAAGNPNMEEIRAEWLTIQNVRLWDSRLLQKTYNQVQGLRPYYYFSDVDVDRYQIEDKYQSVVLSLRELSPDRIEPKAQTWVGLRMIYTHGYGLCMSPVNEVTQEGNPRLIIRDIPPVAERGMNVTQPAIYFGELTTDYVFVKTHQKEFDYPVGADNKYTTYTGKAGVSISGLMRRLVFAWHLGDKNILFTDQFKADSRILLRRHIRRRAQAIAPFLRYDKDPYPVLVNGRILWILDAYTTTSRYPYSTRTYDESDAGVTNYIRNAVKVVIDAYDGTVTFYISDPEDPIIRTIQAIFPGMFASMATDMPQELRDHIRYPLDLFDIQAHQYAVYHMTDPQVFFTKEDKWSRPQETYGSRGEVDVESYYIIMRLPGEEKAEFLLMLPFVPSTKDNLIGWMAGRCDGADYGKLLVYEFPKEKLLYGPRQVEARIDQNAEISKELTLWGAKEGGSSVIRGNLLVIPIADSIMYVEPLYIQAEKGAIPQLKRIIVAHKDKLVMSKTLDDAIASVFARRLASPMVTKPKVVVPLVPFLKASLSKQAKTALEHYNKAMQHLKEGQWEKFGKEIEALRKALEALAASDAKTKDSKD